MNDAFKYSSMLAFACAFGLAAVSTPTINFLYSGDNHVAGNLLSVLALSLVAVGLANVTNNILQAIGKSYLAIISVVVGTLVKSVLTWVLVSIPALNIYGAPIATNIAYPVMVIMNLYFIKKNFGYTLRYKTVFVKPLIAGLACYVSAIGFTKLFNSFLPETVALFAVILCAGSVFIGVVFALKLVTFNEVKRILKKNVKSP